LARDMKLKVVAEGVEQADQRDWLSRMDCDFGQGYLFSKPLSAIDTRAWLVKANVPGANFALT
jgi:EAL domain-containing protein (putative c-di-GMP-specific phosphodiesterase class I)